LSKKERVSARKKTKKKEPLEVREKRNSAKERLLERSRVFQLRVKSVEPERSLEEGAPKPDYWQTDLHEKKRKFENSRRRRGLRRQLTGLKKVFYWNP